LIVTVPEGTPDPEDTPDAVGTPDAPVTLTATVVNEQEVATPVCIDVAVLDWTVIVVVVPTETAKAGIDSAKPNPATNSSRKLRRFMPLTCACSKVQNRAPPISRSQTLLYLARVA
jgi:hypothetical protein